MKRHPRKIRISPRRVAWLTLAGVSAGAGLISYTHALRIVAVSLHLPVPALAPQLVVWAEPFLADLVILGQSANLVDASKRISSWRDLPWLTIAGIVVAGTVTMWMNVAYSDPHQVPRWLVNGWPPVAFGLALESLLSLVRRGRDQPDPDEAGQDQTVSTSQALSVLLSTGSVRELADALGVNKYRIGVWRDITRQDQPSPASQPDPALNGSGGGHG